MVEGIEARFLSILHSKSKTFLAFCFSFLVGVIVASIADVSSYSFFLIVILSVTLFVLGFFWNHANSRFFLLMLICFLGGAIRLAMAFPSNQLPPLSQFTGFISAEPDIRIGDARYIIETGGKRLYVKTGLYPEYRYGDVVHVACTVEPPAKDIEGFRYGMYLARLGVFWLCQNPVIKKIGEGEGNPVLRAILSLKYVLQTRVEELWPEPKASFMAGLLYGYRGGLGELEEGFRRTGVSHIIAISGYNITIIATILMSALTFVYIQRQRAFWIVCVGIIGFTLLVGASPSVVRAAVMGLLALTAKQIGRPSRAIYLLVPTAAAMVLHNPFILLWDAGFQLSFAATFGLLSFARLLAPYLKKVGSETCAAILFTLPLLLYHFGQFSLVAPLVNILILWLIPWLMLGGAIAIFLSVLWTPLGFVVAWVVSFGLQYILLIVSGFSRFSFAAFDISLPWWGVIFAYVLLFFLFRFLDRRQTGLITSSL